MAELRDRIKLRLDIASGIISALGLVSIFFAAEQLRISARASTMDAYARLSGLWASHLNVMVDRPFLFPYFEEMVPLENQNPKRVEILLYGDMRLNIMDEMLTLSKILEWRDIDGWKRTFDRAFRKSSALCDRFNETKQIYGLIVTIGEGACLVKKSPA